MKIALASSLSKITNTGIASGQETWAVNFILESIKKDYVFDLFAVRKSLSIPNKVNLISVVEESTFEKKNQLIRKNDEFIDEDVKRISFIGFARTMTFLKEREKDYSLVIDSTGNALISMNWDMFNIPLLIIAHLPVENRYLSLYKYFPIQKNTFFVFISKYQYERANWIPEQNKFLIYNGILLEDIKLSVVGNQNDLVWVGRIDPSMKKGAKEAVGVAKKVNKNLKMYTLVENEKYFSEQIKPILNEKIIIHTDFTPKDEIYKDKKAFIYPLLWEEPFGLVLIEAMAYGIPVVTFARGATPEIVKDGITGFIVNYSDQDIRGNWIIKKTGIEGFCEAVEKIYSMSEREYQAMRLACRKHVEEKFTAKKMVEDYEKIYSKILSKI